MKKIELLSHLIHPRPWFIKLFLLIGIIAISVLGYYGHLKSTVDLLNSETFSVTIASKKISLYLVLERLTLLILIMGLAGFLVEKGKKYFRRLRRIKPSNKSLVINIYQIAVYFFTFLIVLNIFQVQLSSLAFIGGAVAIGIGFGLQKITSNFISGIILLFEKSIEEGDLVELENGMYGYVRNTGARYTLVETTDGKEVMIPNEEFIVKNVTNWTYSSKKGRMEVAVGVSYKCDIEKARELIIEAAKESERCLKDPEPQCYLDEYGDNSVNFVLLFWIDDVTQGRRASRSDVMRAIWKKFKANNIEIPFPQRDVHIVSGDVNKN